MMIEKQKQSKLAKGKNKIENKNLVLKETRERKVLST